MRTGIAKGIVWEKFSLEGSLEKNGVPEPRLFYGTSLIEAIALFLCASTPSLNASRVR